MFRKEAAAIGQHGPALVAQCAATAAESWMPPQRCWHPAVYWCCPPAPLPPRRTRDRPLLSWRVTRNLCRRICPVLALPPRRGQPRAGSLRLLGWFLPADLAGRRGRGPLYRPVPQTGRIPGPGRACTGKAPRRAKIRAPLQNRSAGAGRLAYLCCRVVPRPGGCSGGDCGNLVVLPPPVALPAAKLHILRAGVPAGKLQRTLCAKPCTVYGVWLCLLQR